MATLREIRRKLGSVQNIQKITQAMEMVAASRLRRAQAKAELSRPYFTKLRDILHKVVAASPDFSHPLIDGREVKNKIGFVIIAGDRGLCGSYNNNVFTATEKELKKFNPSQIELTLIGRKANDHFSNKSWKIANKVVDWGGKITYQQVENLSRHLMDQFTAGALDEVWLIYTHYINTAARSVMIEKLLNIEVLEQENDLQGTASYIFEPSIGDIFATVLPRYAAAKIQSALHESYASELAARIFSMRAATKNAKEMIGKLTLTRNKVRQSNITRELIEITACVESLK